MRIIAGNLRGRRIFSVPRKLGVRPISARMRQSLFDILRPKSMGSRFLDLFAGTGAVGMEALSRGAELVVFLEKDPRCLKVIEKNIARAGLSPRAQVYRGDATQNLSWVFHKSGGQSFDLVFLGPPYKDALKRPLLLTQATLEAAALAGLIQPDGWLIAQHHKKEEPAPPAGYELFRKSKYGDTLMSFFRKYPSPLTEFPRPPSPLPLPLAGEGVRRTGEGVGFGYV